MGRWGAEGAGVAVAARVRASRGTKEAVDVGEGGGASMSMARQSECGRRRITDGHSSNGVTVGVTCCYGPVKWGACSRRHFRVSESMPINERGCMYLNYFI